MNTTSEVPEGADGLVKSNPALISTWSGRYDDIAHALANICRFGGHVQRFRSVAAHSLQVAMVVQEWCHDDRLTLTALLHDASEAYLGDIVRPMKRNPAIGVAYDAAERAAEQSIARAFGLSWPYPSVIHEADDEVLRIELEWRRTGELPNETPGYCALPLIQWVELLNTGTSGYEPRKP